MEGPKMKFENTAHKILIYILQLLLLWWTGIEATSIVTSTETCHFHCQLDDKSMECTGCIPETIPENVTIVNLVDIDNTSLIEGVFCHPPWESVIQLSILCDKRCIEIGYIYDSAFRCLDNLQMLKLSLQKWFIDGKKAFEGLPKVSTLDLTGCFKICTPDIITLLSDRTQIPKVTQLVLSGLGSECRPRPYFSLNQTLFDLVATRNIKTIDMSSSTIYCDPVNIKCTSLSKLNISNANVVNDHMIENRFVCDSLRVVDISRTNKVYGAILPNVINVTSDKPVIIDEKGYPPLLSTVTTLYANGLLSVNHLENIDVKINLVAKNNLKDLHFSGYNIPKFEIEFYFKYNYMENLTLSNNRIEIIGSKIFRNFSLLRKVDISHNKLGISNSSTEALSVLFRENVRLEEINIANNSLLEIPRQTFLSNNLLENIDLSGNKLKQITFNISHLANLTSLNMRNNYIETLDLNSRNTLDKLYCIRKKQLSTGNNASLLVDLRGNRFVCDCRSINFLRWFVDSPIFSSSRHLYHCMADGQPVTMTTAAVEAAENDCERPKRRMRKIIYLSVLPTIGVLALSIAFLGVRNKYKEKMRQRRLRDHTRRIHNDDLDTAFLAFLSFSSEDERFVAENVFQHLTVIYNYILRVYHLISVCNRIYQNTYESVSFCMFHCGIDGIKYVEYYLSIIFLFR